MTVFKNGCDGELCFISYVEKNLWLTSFSLCRIMILFRLTRRSERKGRAALAVFGRKIMLAKFSVKKPYTVVVAVIVVLLLGIISFMGMQTDLLPSIDLP